MIAKYVVEEDLPLVLVEDLGEDRLEKRPAVDLNVSRPLFL